MTKRTNRVSHVQANMVTTTSGYAKAAVAGGSSGKMRGTGRIKPRFVACPECGAEVNVSCKTITGKPTTHAARRRLATRMANKERGI